MRSLLILLLACPFLALAQDYRPSLTAKRDPPMSHTVALKGGAGVLRSADQYFTQVKYLALSAQWPLWKSLKHQFEMGAYLDTQKQLGRKSAYYAAYQVGPHMSLGYFYAEMLTGVGFISHPDTILGGPFQFFHDLGVGLRDEDGFGIGVGYKHISSAGLETPNLGRDLIYLKVTIPFGAP